MKMKMRQFYILSAAILLWSVAVGASALAQDTPRADEKPATDASASPEGEAPAKPAADKPTEPAKPAEPKHATILKDAKPIPGLINLHKKENDLYAELSSSNYSTEFIVLISIARGIGQGSLLGGMSWGFGDDWVWQFRKVDNRVLVVRKNVRFKAEPGSREAFAVTNAYTDSVLFSLPILTKGPNGGDLIDLTQVFMSDLPQISRILPGFAFSAPKSTWASVKGFKDNVELQVAATYASSGQAQFDSVADSRGVTINIHYSISSLPKASGYTPRLADNRVGYFLTVVKDYSKDSDRDHFVRYVNRWHLEKDDPKLKISPPKEKIVFYIEKTVPAKYRPAIEAGILEWNKAFEKAGFANAIEVRTQAVDDEWDPEDINYNTFRWITASAGFAMGPSRVNPYTGQILDADIIFDADFLTFWKDEFETFTQQSIAAMTIGPYETDDEREGFSPTLLAPHHKYRRCMLGHGMARQLAFGATALMKSDPDPAKTEELREKLILQGLKEVTMHEVGHTLGLRHNFKASTWRSLKDMNDPGNNGDGMVASVMDYHPANIVPQGWHQGDYFPTTIGPYDVWAIEYGYTPFSGGTFGEVKELQKIASRSGEPALAYTTDEDTVASDPDPLSNRFDLGDDSLEYAKLRAQTVQELMPGLVDRMTKDGDDYVQARRAFNVLLSQHGQSMFFASRYVGGLHTSRSHKGDEGAKPPIEVIDPQKQREALKLLEEQMFSEKPFQFSPEVYNYLGPTRWQHWGLTPTRRKDFPIHEYIGMWQQQVLEQLLSPVTLERIHDTELKVPADQDVLTAAELVERLTRSIFSEVTSLDQGPYTNRDPAISSLRRNLQRIYLRQLSLIAMGSTKTPDDCQTVAYAELSALQTRIKKVLKGKTKLDSYSQAHLQETESRIGKVLDARLTLARP